MGSPLSVVFADSVVNCRKFVEAGCLGVTLAGLSSEDPGMRGAARHVLDRFQQHLGGARWAGQEQLVHLLGLLQPDMGGVTARLPALSAAFLSRTASLLLKPGENPGGFLTS